MSWILPVSVFGSLALGMLAPLLHRRLGVGLGRVLAVWPLVLFASFASLALPVANGVTVRAAYRWFSIPLHWLPLSDADGASAPGIHVGFHLDGLALLFVLLITGIGALVLFYAGSYLGKGENHAAFFAYLMLFVGAMLGVVLADNLFVLYLFWELTSITSFLLIGFWSHREESRKGALKALLVTASGGLALLAGSVLILVITGSADLATILASRELLHGHSLYPVVLLLVLLGAFTKSAQVPFHLWLPNAMEAPTPVSAYLHSAAMVKAGIYLVARMSSVVGGSALWVWVLSAVGITSLVFGAYLALRQRDLKAILAFSTISQLGLMMTLFGWGTPLAITAALFHILNHSVFKAALFMMVGIVDKQTKTRDIDRLKGLGPFMPVTGIITLVAALALGGFPPLNGFVSKEMFFSASLEAGGVLTRAGTPGFLSTYLFPTLAVVGSVFTFVYSLIISHGIFYKRGRQGGGLEDVVEPTDPPVSLWIAPAMLAGAVILGLAPGIVDKNVVAPAVHAVLGQPVSVPLALWHGVNAPLLMSLGVMVLGMVLYVGFGTVQRALRSVPTRPNVNALYDWSLDALTKVSEFIVGRMMTGFTRDYLAYLLGFLVILVGVTVVSTGAFPLRIDWPPAGTLEWTELLFSVLIAAATLSIPFFRTRVATVLALGVIGMSLVMLWTLFRAPDLALTMLVVDTITLLLYLLVFVYLPRLRQDVFPRVTRWVNALIAAGTGMAVTLLMLGARGIRDGKPVADWYVENSLPAAKGSNVVNVILVDFRGFDTLLETTILTLAGLGVYILASLRFKGGPK